MSKNISTKIIKNGIKGLSCPFNSHHYYLPYYMPTVKLLVCAYVRGRVRTSFFI